MWGGGGVDSEVQEGGPGSRGDAFMVMAQEACLSNDINF